MSKSKAKKTAAKELVKAGLKKAGKKLLSGVVGVGGALLNTQKAYGGQPTAKQRKARQALRQDYYDTLGPIKKTKMSTKRPKKSNKICPAGIAWAKRTFDKYPSAYANMAASKYCKDPNYGKKSKKK
jgi:hypothetical protein